MTEGPRSFKEYFWTEEKSVAPREPEADAALVDRHIDAFIEKKNAEDAENLELQSFETGEGVVMLVAKRSQRFPFEFMRRFMQYWDEKERPRGGGGRSDCWKVAERAAIAGFADGYFIVDTPYSSDDTRTTYKFHALNYIRLHEKGGHGDTHMHMAFDATAKYNLDADTGRYTILAFAADSPEKLTDYLREFYAGSTVELFRSETAEMRRKAVEKETVVDLLGKLNDKGIHIGLSLQSDANKHVLLRLVEDLQGVDARLLAKAQSRHLTIRLSGDNSLTVEAHIFPMFRRAYSKTFSLMRRGAFADFLEREFGGSSFMR